MRERARVRSFVFSAVLLLCLLVARGLAATGYAGGKPWQIGDVIVCFGSGTCNVLRLSGNTVTLLDQFSDGIGGNTNGVAINNTLHLLVTDGAASQSGSTSNVIEYTIASLDPLQLTPTVVNHVPATFAPFSDSGANAQAIVVNSAGQLFVGNAGNGSAPPSIAQLNPNGTLATAASVPPLVLPTNPLVLSGQFASCVDSAAPALLSMDLSSRGDALYITSAGGSIQKLSLSSTSSATSCTPFANFGSGVTLYGIKDVPPQALANVSSCNGTPCPAGESILVVAKGFTDPDALENGETPGPGDPDAVNVCTNLNDGTTVSCALLLDTNTNPGLTAPLWQANTQYFTLGSNILDPFLHLETVLTAGTSGAQEPAFTLSGGTLRDNAVIWTNKGRPAWAMDTAYAAAAFPGTYIVDSNGNLQTVTASGTSSHSQPSWNTSGSTTDGLVWNDRGVWQANHLFSPGAAVGDPAAHPHTVLTAGTSGAISPIWNDGGGTTIDNAVTWTNQGPILAYSASHQYALNTLIAPNGHAQQAIEPGTSGAATPNFSTSGGQTIDGAVIWTDQGQEFWHPGYAFSLGDVVVDPAGHLQQVTVAGTSGTTQPAFNDSGSTITDNTVTWTDQGVLQWSANHNYDGSNAPNTFVVDPANHVQKATTTGTSGPGQPVFNDGGTTLDGSVVWTDQGKKFWYPNFAYAATSIVVDAAGHVQQVTTPGTSGPTQPTFNDSNGTVVDGLQWTDAGQPSTWAANKVYAQNAIITDGAGHIQQAVTGGTSGASQPGFNDNGGTTPDGSDTLVWQDRGIPGSWTANTQYPQYAIILDGSGNVQQAIFAGTSGATAPTFATTIGGVVPDNAVVWSDGGLLSGNPTFTWKPTNSYTAGAQIIDTSNHVQKVTTAGMSANNPPTFNDGGTVVDGLVWLDLGPAITWAPSTAFSAGTLLVDSNQFLEKVTTAGISTTPNPPAWNTTVGGITIDGLQWSDQGHLVWQANTHYWTLGALISDGNAHAQSVIESGTSGGSTPAFSTNGGNTLDNAVIWAESHPMWQANQPFTAGAAGSLILDPTNTVELATTSGITGPLQPSFAAALNATTTDGLQWTTATPALSSVIARYPVIGKNTLQSLALDPLVANCTGVKCATTLQPLTLSNFWLGDTGSATFYKLDFASGANGAPTPLNGSPACNSPCRTFSSIQAIGMYGAESANQPGLAKLLTGSSLNSGNNFTASVTFPPSSNPNDLNNWTITAYGTSSALPSATTIPLTLYGSLIPYAAPATKGGNNSGVSDPGTVTSIASGYLVIGSTPCEPTTTSPNNCVIWKADLTLPPNSYLAEAITSPTGVDSGTDLFVDLHYDVTTSVGTADPVGKTYSSVHSVHEVTSSVPPGQSGCFYLSPLQNQCYKTNRNTLNFTFQCPGLTQQQFLNLANAPGPPLLSLVRKFPNQTPKPAPQVIQLSTTNNKAPYRYSSSVNAYTLQWNVTNALNSNQISKTGTTNLRGCTFDPTGTVQTFCVDFTMNPSCKQ